MECGETGVNMAAAPKHVAVDTWKEKGLAIIQHHPVVAETVLDLLQGKCGAVGIRVLLKVYIRTYFKRNLIEPIILLKNRKLILHFE